MLGVVNCTGLGAGKLVQDTAVFPTRGQTIIVKGKAARIATRSGDAWEALVIPRPGANETLLGGCKIANDWYSSVTCAARIFISEATDGNVGVLTLTIVRLRSFSIAANP